MDGSPQTQAVLEERLARILGMAGTDEGFYVLALHSLMEAYICDRDPRLRSVEHFSDRLRAFGDQLRSQGCRPEDLRTLSRIIQEHALANSVRDSFTRLDREEALAATHNFLRFCSLCGIGSKRLEELGRSLSLWDDKRSPLGQSKELSRIQVELSVAQRDAAKLLPARRRGQRTSCAWPSWKGRRSAWQRGWTGKRPGRMQRRKGWMSFERS